MSKKPTIHLHKGDLPDGVTFGDCVAIDTETMGLNPHRDGLCLAQLSAGDRESYDAPNMKALLADGRVLKLFHFARFDVATLGLYLGVSVQPVYCTKLASKLVRTYTDRHGLKDLAKELVGVDLSKQQQSSDWGAAELTPAQQEYAASDVLYLHKIKAALDEMLAREGRTAIAQAAFDFLPTRAALDLAGWAGEDIFSH